MAYVFRSGDLPRLDLQVDRGSDFKAWKDQWKAYLSLSGLKNEDATKQVQALTLCFSRETITIVNNLGLSDAEREDATTIVTKISEFVEGQTNESVERRHFRQRRQQPGESFDDFLVSLRELAKTCKFCSEDCTQKAIRDQIVEGILDGDVIEELLRDSKQTNTRNRHHQLSRPGSSKTTTRGDYKHPDRASTSPIYSETPTTKSPCNYMSRMRSRTASRRTQKLPSIPNHLPQMQQARTLRKSLPQPPTTASSS